ncbi:hypothetical protein IJ135_02835, partial [Candidatus Saccharibacteria bacterium]|nr:hypothetical protein [Candidatus Saccharibacteria bacterium]
VSTSGTMTTSGITLSLDFYRNTYALTINRNTTYISSVSGAGTYRWGQSVSISATPATNSKFTTWSQISGTTSSFASATTVSTTFTMPKSDATIYADGTSSNVTIATATYMQDVNSCPSSLATEVTYTLKDKRDNQEYTVAKLKDGKCWMTKNLNIAGGAVLTSADTDFTDSYFSSYSAGNSRLAKTSTGLQLPASALNGGFYTNNYSYVYNTSNNSCLSGSACYSYYSWDAATLGSGRSIGAANQDAPYSICPKGWKMPSTRTGTNSTADYRALFISLGGSASIYQYTSSTSPTASTMASKITASPYNYFRPGYCNYGMCQQVNDGGGFWTSTSADSSNNALNLGFGSGWSAVGLVDSNGRFLGLGVRCLFAS